MSESKNSVIGELPPQSTKTDSTPTATTTVSDLAEEEQTAEAGPAEDAQAKEEPNMLRKAAVGVAGGALFAVGIPLIPFPAPVGVPCCAGGLALLATEFPAAQRLIDKSRDGIQKFADGADAEEKNDAKDGEVVDEGFEIVEPDDCDEKTLAEEAKKLQTVHPHDEIDMAIDQAMERGKKRLQRLTKNALLPLMNNISSKKVVQKEEEKVEDFSLVEKVDSNMTQQ